ncbi:LuxR C-terminal-related transcriptional regulator [Microbacterium sp.]|uniref:LuxR C-terminal-related transcriptional regulator n=1 Tax=Microbacterium sp. TaxID=51671 RepID=UPI0025D493AD|nr:LuxR C-terminal-related transcriptional regulator [Microbacterium sp.]
MTAPLGRLTPLSHASSTSSRLERGSHGVLSHPVEHYYRCDPHVLRELLSHERPTDPTARRVRDILVSLIGGNPYTGRPRKGVIGVPPDAWARAIRLRTAGTPRSALELVQTTGPAPVSSVQIDASQGWNPFMTMWRGSTALLAGDLPEAEAHLDRARMWRVPREVSALQREACSWSVLLQAFFGDPSDALTEIQVLDDLPRTESWVESDVAAARYLAGEALRESPRFDRGSAEPIARWSLRETWPFLFWLQSRSAVRRGAATELDIVIDSTARAGWPGAESRQGIAGSALPLVGALSAALRGDAKKAREQLSRADSRSDFTTWVSAGLLLDIGDQDAASEAAARLLDRSCSLRRIRITANAVLAAVALERRDASAAEEHLGELRLLARPLSSTEITRLPAAVRAALEEHRDKGAPAEIGPRFTRADRELLQMLESGLSRGQIAANLYISINTVKTRLRLLYRKLNVGNAADAVVAAHRRGLL